MDILTRAFYDRDTIAVARDLLGKHIVRRVGKGKMSARIQMVEAYLGEQDTASHAAHGFTERTAVMFGEAAHAYVYFIYGKYYMFNIVTEHKEEAGAVLIRQAIPEEGIELMRENRGTKRDLCNGPANLCRALQIDKDLNEHDLTIGKRLWLEDGDRPNNTSIEMGPRLGIDYAIDFDKNANLRFWLEKK